MKYNANSDNSNKVQNHSEEVARTGTAFVSAFSALAYGRSGYGLFNEKSPIPVHAHNDSSIKLDEQFTSLPAT